MRSFSRWIVVLALAIGSGVAAAGEGIRLASGGEAVFTLNLPVLLPPLVVIQPGVSVVRDVDAEVFYANGYYWSRRDEHWYRAQDHRGTWARVDTRSVPVAIQGIPPGRYKNYKGEKHGDHDNGKGHGNGKGNGHGEDHS